MAKDTGYIKTAMTQGDGGSSPEPSGSVVCDGKVSTQGLPARTGGRIPEVTYDTNGKLPGRLGGE
jgi:hypothetical protein